jgi:hypothetical protein
LIRTFIIGCAVGSSIALLGGLFVYAVSEYERELELYYRELRTPG